VVDWISKRSRTAIGRTNASLKPGRSPTYFFIANPSPSSIYRTNDLLLGPNRVIHVMTALSAAIRKTNVTTFAIDTDNNITAHGTPEEAAASTATPFDTFASQRELTELVTGWPAERLMAIQVCSAVTSTMGDSTACGRRACDAR
jgi:hypothetical protein